MKKISVYITVIVLLFSFSGIAFAVNYPKPMGFVNDFADILPADSRNDLEQTLKKYEDETSIEIAVVTVKSLEGLAVEDYTIGLANTWGVGKKEKDNGIVFLIAPQEREMRIEVGYGTEPDLTDVQAGRIIQKIITPHFKAGRMADGIVSGTKAILETLGNKPYEDRLAERKKLTEQKQIRAQRNREQFFNIFLIGGIIFAISASMIFAVALMIKSARKKAFLKKIYLENEEMLAEGGKNLDKAEKKYPPVLSRLMDLRRNNPETIWSELDKRYQNFFNDVHKLRWWMAKLSAKEQKDFKQSTVVKPDVEVFFKESQKVFSLLNDIENTLKKVADAKKISSKLEQEILLKLKNMEKEVGHNDVTEDTKKSLQITKQKYDNAKKLTEEPLVDWIALLALLSAINKEMQEISKLADNDISYAKTAREKGPELLKTIPLLVIKAGKKVSDSDVSSSTRRLVTDAEKKFQKTASDINTSRLTWITAYGLLLAIQSQLNDAIDDIEESRRGQSTSYGSYSSGSLGWSSGGSNHFGGFSGGSFGGGGASGSW